eukprot:5476472-Amphidinium_carterae.1
MYRSTSPQKGRCIGQPHTKRDVFPKVAVCGGFLIWKLARKALRAFLHLSNTATLAGREERDGREVHARFCDPSIFLKLRCLARQFVTSCVEADTCHRFQRGMASATVGSEASTSRRIAAVRVSAYICTASLRAFETACTVPKLKASCSLRVGSKRECEREMCKPLVEDRPKVHTSSVH